MNTYLEALFEKYNISPENRYEIMQVYTLLPDKKKQNLLNNFDSLAISLQVIEKEIELEREILLGKAAISIGEAILKNKGE